MTNSAPPIVGNSLFDLVLGLPLHPLVVHAAVVLLPLAAIGLIGIVLIPRARKPLGWLVMCGLVVGVGSSLLAKESGEALAARVGLPSDHAYWGDLLPYAALGLAVIGGIWFWMQRVSAKRKARSWLVRLVGAFAIVAAIATCALTVVVGHTGAIAVWEGKIQTAPASQTPGPAPSPASSAAITMTDVASHNSAEDCWSVVDGTVYDLTSWISQHPGGTSPIESMCGVDATDAFNGQHGGQQTPAKVLAGFALGSLAG